MFRFLTRLFLAALLLSPITLLASKRIVVDLSHQIAIAYQDGRVLFYGRISSGKPGRRTPTGSFYVREKALRHVSNLWPAPNGGARMPYMLRLTRDGIAMHLGPTPDYPASHGCIRMRDGFAQRMFAWAQKWTHVDVIGTPPAHSPAVALPAYARSQKMLRRSMGGGAGNPLNILSDNPKTHKASLAKVPSLSVSHTPHRIRLRHVVSHHAHPLDALSGRTGSSLRSASRNTRPHKFSHKRHKRNTRRKHNRHPSPSRVLMAH